MVAVELTVAADENIWRAADVRCVKQLWGSWFSDFRPDACLINCYILCSKMPLHQDKDEQDLTQLIVSFLLGLPAEFFWGTSCDELLALMPTGCTLNVVDSALFDLEAKQTQQTGWQLAEFEMQ